MCVFGAFIKLLVTIWRKLFSGREHRNVHQAADSHPCFLLIRHAERIDLPLRFLWYNRHLDKKLQEYKPPKWPSVLGRHGIYPRSLPRRGEIAHYRGDPPLTRRGEAAAWMIGRRMKLASINITAIISSPALRCLSTARAIARGAGISDVTKINVEPALYERCPQPLKGMTTQELVNAGFNISTSYEPYLQFLNFDVAQETPSEFCNRQKGVLNHIRTKMDGTNGCVVIVGHQSTIGEVYHHDMNVSYPRCLEFQNLPYLGHELLTLKEGGWHRELFPYFETDERQKLLDQRLVNRFIHMFKPSWACVYCLYFQFNFHEALSYVFKVLSWMKCTSQN